MLGFNPVTSTIYWAKGAPSVPDFVERLLYGMICREAGASMNFSAA
jgi:hypothetical protein